MQFFITGTGTNIGKTFVLEKICQKLIMGGKKLSVIKPIISGFSYDDLNSDSAKILKILGKDLNQQNLDEISPYRFFAPLSPNIAAELENRNIDFLELINFCENKIAAAKKNNGYLLIEGAGGVMTPVNNNKNFTHLIAKLNIPTILVAGNYLGSISHTLSAIAAMQSYGITIAKIILNCQDDDQINAEDTLKTLITQTQNLNFTTVIDVLD